MKSYADEQDRHRSTAMNRPIGPTGRFGAAGNAFAIVGFVLLVAILGWYQRPAPIPVYNVVVRSYAKANPSRVAPPKATVKIASAPTRPAVYPCERRMTRAQRQACIFSHLQAADRNWSHTFLQHESVR